MNHLNHFIGEEMQPPIMDREGLPRCRTGVSSSCPAGQCSNTTFSVLGKGAEIPLSRLLPTFHAHSVGEMCYSQATNSLGVHLTLTAKRQEQFKEVRMHSRAIRLSAYLSSF